MKDNPLRDNKLIATLIKLKREDQEAFMNLIISTLKAHPEVAIDDAADPDFKLKALETLLVWLESKEEYEDCAFIFDLKKKIGDGKDQ